MRTTPSFWFPASVGQLLNGEQHCQPCQATVSVRCTMPVFHGCRRNQPSALLPAASQSSDGRSLSEVEEVVEMQKLTRLTAHAGGERTTGAGAESNCHLLKARALPRNTGMMAPVQRLRGGRRPMREGEFCFISFIVVPI